MVQAHPLKQFRETHDPPLSQGDLASMLGVSNITVWRWEAGKRKVDAELVPRVAEKTGIARAILRPDLSSLLQEAAE